MSNQEEQAVDRLRLSAETNKADFVLVRRIDLLLILDVYYENHNTSFEDNKGKKEKWVKFSSLV